MTNRNGMRGGYILALSVWGGAVIALWRWGNLGDNKMIALLVLLLIVCCWALAERDARKAVRP